MLFRLIILIVVSISFINCEKEELHPKEELDTYTCVDGMCFGIDRTVQPDTYVDANGYWHIKHWGPNYFTIKGKLDGMNEEYNVNDIPLVETRFDSDYWVWFDDITFRIPKYSPFELFTDPQFSTPVPVVNHTVSVCWMDRIADPLNITGYSYGEKSCLDCPYSERLMGTSSADTYSPQQQFYFNRWMKNDTIQVYMRVTNNYDLGESEEQDYMIKLIVD